MSRRVIAKTEYLIHASDDYETIVETVSTRKEVRAKIAYFKKNGWKLDIYRSRLMHEKDFALSEKRS